MILKRSPMSQILSQLLSHLPSKPALQEEQASRGEPNADGYYHENLTKDEVDRLAEKFNTLTNMTERMMILMENLDETEVHDETLHDMEGYKLHHLLKKAGHTHFGSFNKAAQMIGELHELFEEMHMETMTSLRNVMNDMDED